MASSAVSSVTYVYNEVGHHADLSTGEYITMETQQVSINGNFVSTRWSVTCEKWFSLHPYCRPGGPFVQTKWREHETVRLATPMLVDTFYPHGPSHAISVKDIDQTCLDLSGLTREERVMVQASTNNERDFDEVADALIIQPPRIDLREGRKRAKGRGKDGIKSSDN